MTEKEYDENDVSSETDEESAGASSSGNNFMAKSIYAKESVSSKANEVFDRFNSVEQRLLMVENSEKRINQGLITAYDDSGQCLLCRTGDYHFLFSTAEDSWGTTKKCRGAAEADYQAADDYRANQFRLNEQLLRSSATNEDTDAVE